MIILFIAIAFGLKHYQEDLNYIESVKVAVEYPSISYTLNASENDGKDLEYVPYFGSFSTLELATKDIGFSITSKNSATEDSDAEAGEQKVKESNIFDTQLIGVKGHYLWEIYYQNYQGLYITDDSESIDNSLNHANAYAYGISITRFLDRNFKPKKSFLNWDKEKESNWSWIFGAHLNKNKLYSSNGLIPDIYKPNFEQIQNISEIETTNLGTDFGITGLYTRYNWYISGFLSYGVTLQQQNLKGIETETSYRSSSMSHLLINFGYCFKESHTIGLGINNLSNTIHIQDTEFNSSRTLSSIYWKAFF